MSIVTKFYHYFLRKHRPIEYAKKIGVEIGEGCKMTSSPDWGTEPWLIRIGKHVEITSNVTFLTHDGSTWVFREEPLYRNVFKYGKIIIHDNCFIGYGSIIMPGVEIGENSIVAAGSVVTKTIPTAEVWGGYQLIS